MNELFNTIDLFLQGEGFIRDESLDTVLNNFINFYTWALPGEYSIPIERGETANGFVLVSLNEANFSERLDMMMIFVIDFPSIGLIRPFRNLFSKLPQEFNARYIGDQVQIDIGPIAHLTKDSTASPMLLLRTSLNQWKQNLSGLVDMIVNVSNEIQVQNSPICSECGGNKRKNLHDSNCSLSKQNEGIY